MSLNGQSETELLKTIATNTGASASSTTAGIIDSGNSSTANLSGDAVFTGVWKDTTIYSQFTVIYSADVEGTINMDLSMDGSTVHRSKVVEDTTGGVHTLAVVSKFMRVRWTNGSDAQSTFAIQTILHIHKSKDLTSTMVQQVSNNNDVTLVRDPSIAICDTAREFYNGKTVEHFIGENDAVTTTWTDVSITAPAFCTKTKVTFEAQPSTETATTLVFSWRTNGQTGTTGHQVGDAGWHGSWIRGTYNTESVIMDSSQIIEVKCETSSTHKLAVYTNGYYLPKGI